MFGCLEMNLYLCVFIVFCLPKWFTIKPYLSWTLELNVSSKNKMLNNCSHVNFPAAKRPGSAKTHKAVSRMSKGPPQRYLHSYRALVMNIGALCRKYWLRLSIGTILIALTVALVLFFTLICIQTWKVSHPLALCLQTKLLFLIKHTICSWMSGWHLTHGQRCCALFLCSSLAV